MRHEVRLLPVCALSTHSIFLHGLILVSTANLPCHLSRVLECGSVVSTLKASATSTVNHLLHHMWVTFSFPLGHTCSVLHCIDYRVVCFHPHRSLQFHQRHPRNFHDYSRGDPRSTTKSGRSVRHRNCRRPKFGWAGDGEASFVLLPCQLVYATGLLAHWS